jgi:hypothetical protein
VVSFKDTVGQYNVNRLNINRVGMEVLGSWGIVSMAAGGVGYFTAKQDEWKYFHEMNVLWGAVNTGIAAMGLAGVRKEMVKKMNYQQSYDRYKANKKLYIVNIGFDVLYIATGVGLAEYGASAKSNADIFKGFGKSIAVQGVFLLLFDNVMFAAHQQSNGKWFQLMNEIRVSNAGIGFTHTF